MSGGTWVTVGVVAGYLMGRIKWIRRLAVKIAAPRVARKLANQLPHTGGPIDQMGPPGLKSSGNARRRGR